MGLLDQVDPVQQRAWWIKDAIVGQLNSFKATFDNIQTLVWESEKDGATPEKIMEAMGTDGAQLFYIAQRAMAFINGDAMDVMPSAFLPPENMRLIDKQPKSIYETINKDGTVVLTRT